jgi:hypothetical protein
MTASRTLILVTRLVLILVALDLFSAYASAHPGAGIAVDRAGQIYFLDTGSGLWKIGLDCYHCARTAQEAVATSNGPASVSPWVRPERSW